MRAWIVLLSLVVVGCAQTPSAQRPSLIGGATTIRPPEVAVQSMSKGSLVPQAENASAGGRGLFEERRVSRVGDTMTVVLNETTRASKDGGTRANRQATNTSALGVNFSNATQSSNNANNLNLGLSSSGNNGFDANGAASASNEFSGMITATVMEVLPNGNLVIAGEKRIAVGAEEEFIRFGGVVSPLSIKENKVLSSQVADVRLEYRGMGITDDAQRPGWLTQLMMRYSPN
jgi:flagellar L-ring protein precursor FlgH